MNQSVQSGNKGDNYQHFGRYSSASTDENSHSISNGISLSLQAFVDDIPFEFNPKYRSIVIVSYQRRKEENVFAICFSLQPNVDIPEYDTTRIRDILSKPVSSTEKHVRGNASFSVQIDFTLENKVLLEALEDLQRKKKEIEADTLRQQVPAPSATVTTQFVSI